MKDLKKSWAYTKFVSSSFCLPDCFYGQDGLSSHFVFILPSKLDLYVIKKEGILLKALLHLQLAVISPFTSESSSTLCEFGKTRPSMLLSLLRSSPFPFH